MTPGIGRIVHYVSYGTPGGEYGKACRAAIITEVDSEDTVGLCVLNPTGLFLNRGVRQHELPPPGKILPGELAEHRGGTWHWPERA